MPVDLLSPGPCLLGDQSPSIKVLTGARAMRTRGRPGSVTYNDLGKAFIGIMASGEELPAGVEVRERILSKQSHKEIECRE